MVSTGEHKHSMTVSYRARTLSEFLLLERISCTYIAVATGPWCSLFLLCRDFSFAVHSIHLRPHVLSPLADPTNCCSMKAVIVLAGLVLVGRVVAATLAAWTSTTSRSTSSKGEYPSNAHSLCRHPYLPFYAATGHTFVR